MTEKRKKILGAVIALSVAWIVGIIIHELFLNLQYGVLRSFIVAAGVAVWWYLYKK